MKIKNLYSTWAFILTIVSILLTNPLYAQNNTLEGLDYTQWGVYADHIKECKPGTFQLPNMTVITMLKNMQASGSSTPQLPEIPQVVFEIVGIESGKCLVKFAQVTTAQAGNQPSVSNYVVQCTFPVETLPQLSDWAAQAATGNIDALTNEQNNKIMGEACKF